MAKTKTIRPEIKATLIGFGSGQRSGLCPFESRYLRLRLDDGRIVKWWTETELRRAECCIEMDVVLQANITERNTLQRVVVLSCVERAC
jgi:hypothetical protein